MADNDGVSVSNLKYDPDETEHRRNIVLANQNLYLCSKKKQLRDAEIISKKKMEHQSPICVALW